MSEQSLKMTKRKISFLSNLKYFRESLDTKSCFFSQLPLFKKKSHLVIFQPQGRRNRDRGQCVFTVHYLSFTLLPQPGATVCECCVTKSHVTATIVS